MVRIPVGGSPRGPVKFDNIKMFGYVCNTAGNTLSVIDQFRNREVSRITVGQAPRGLAISEDGKYAFVSNSGSNTISVVDILRRSQIDEIGVGLNPRHMGVLPGKNSVNVCFWGSDVVVTLDYSQGIQNIFMAKAMSVGFDARPYSVAIDSLSGRSYVANTMADYMSILDDNTGKELTRIPVGFGGREAVLSPDRNYVFLSTEVTNEIAVVDLNQNQVVHRVSVGPTPRGLVLNPDLKELFAVAFPRSPAMVGARNSVSVIDVSDPLKASLVDAIPVGQGPCAISMLTR